SGESGRRGRSGPSQRSVDMNRPRTVPPAGARTTTEEKMVKTENNIAGAACEADAYLARFAEIHTLGVESILGRGEVLIEAKAHLDHGQWRALCDGLPFTERHAHRFRCIAEHKTLSNRTYMSSLPDGVVVLHTLSKL